MRWIALLAAVLLAGCGADLDWRELRARDAGFVASLPGRAFEESRPLAGREGVQMHQWSARARNTVFAVGYADFPRIDAATLAGLRDALVRNIGGRMEKEQPIVLGDANGVEVLARGEGGGAPLELRLRLLARGARVYQAATLGPPGELSPTELETFFGSLKLETAR